MTTTIKEKYNKFISEQVNLTPREIKLFEDFLTKALQDQRAEIVRDNLCKKCNCDKIS